MSEEKTPNPTANIPSLSYRKSEQLFASFQFMLTNFAFCYFNGTVKLTKLVTFKPPYEQKSQVENRFACQVKTLTFSDDMKNDRHNGLLNSQKSSD